MPTDSDRASASIRFESEAHRLTLQTMRLDRDGLFLFGRRYAAQTVTLTAGEGARLHTGRVITVHVAGQYLIYLLVDQRDNYGSDPATASAAAPRCSGCTGDGIPQREGPDRVPSDFVRVVAARVRVNAGRRAGIHTRHWIIDLAKSQHFSYGRRCTGTPKPPNPARDFRRLWPNWRVNEQPCGHPRRSRGGSR